MRRAPLPAHHLLRVRQVGVALEVQVTNGAGHVERAVDAVVPHKAPRLQATAHTSLAGGLTASRTGERLSGVRAGIAFAQHAAALRRLA